MEQEVVLCSDGTSRCWWGVEPEVYCEYHDNEWGRPVSDDRLLFEKICLEGFQSGLSWLTILRKRAGFRDAFADFDYSRVSLFTERSIERLVLDPRIVRHRGKIVSTVNNAHRAKELVGEFGSLAAYFWSWEPEAASSTEAPIPSKTAQSIGLSKDLRKRGWTYVGPTTVYAFMQAVGIVNDHLPGCHCHSTCAELRRSFPRPK